METVTVFQQDVGSPIQTSRIGWTGGRGCIVRNARASSCHSDMAPSYTVRSRYYIDGISVSK